MSAIENNNRAIASTTFPQKIVHASFYLAKLCFSTGYWTASLILSPFSRIFACTLSHSALCDKVQKAFQEMHSGAKVVLEPKDTTHLFRPTVEKEQRIDLRGMDRVLAIDKKAMVATVQGMTTFDTLVTECLKVGLRPKVVPELRGITVGGAIAGLAVESSSFKYGLFHETVKEIEVLNGKGQIIICDNKNNTQLFDGIPNSYGTLGYILSAKIELVPVKPFVALLYEKFSDVNTYFQALEAACKSEIHDFIDGVIFSKESMVLVLGKEVEHVPTTSDYVRDGIYYKAIKEKSSDFLTIEQYLWRWDHDSFWSTEGTLLQKPFMRKLFGESILRSDRLIQISRALKDFNKNVTRPFSRVSENHEEMIQDVGVPLRACAQFFKWFNDEIGVLPLFICPIRPPRKEAPLWKIVHQGEIYCDFGFFGAKKTSRNPAEGYFNKKVEAQLPKIGGLKSLYSRVFYDQPTFEALYYGGDAYKRLKKCYDPNQMFPLLFDKCVKTK